MGGTTSQQSSKDLFSTFIEIKRDQMGTILQHKQTQLQYLLKEYTLTDDNQFESQRSML